MKMELLLLVTESGLEYLMKMKAELLLLCFCVS